MIIEISQILKIEKYKTGIPKTCASLSKMNMKGIFKIRNVAIDNSTSFCSWRFFNFKLFFYLWFLEVTPLRVSIRIFN